jgi:hypothetical protein
LERQVKKTAEWGCPLNWGRSALDSSALRRRRRRRRRRGGGGGRRRRGRRRRRRRRRRRGRRFTDLLVAKCVIRKPSFINTKKYSFIRRKVCCLLN